MDRKSTLYVGALAKGLRVLRAFDDAHPELSLSELVVRTGLDKSAVQRLSHTLHMEGMLEKDPGTRRFRPSHAWLQMAYAYYWSDQLVPLALPKMIELSRVLGETVNLAELSGDHIIYVTRLPCKRTDFAASVAGRRLPAISTAAGRAILSTFTPEERATAAREWPMAGLTPRAELDREVIARDIEEAVQVGYAISRDQMILNEIAIAAPIRGADGRAVGAAQCSVSAHSWEEDAIRREILPLLQDTANSIAPSRGRRR
ncbi:IclR family transcriptional regulator [Rhodalgimonas zhirmunskyi]|uniref:Helix-turn-helix domain-containing protein n=1 Tax=Rhodalgimonas zhirmunskyi TaxID=2964767 RepID=A0AAJ1U8K7_9RHOB|nr:IclR family transcriptional regulator C-terminal domain-containing protein [Rhodoalgimonas zhirmunskyi]MDQ2094949.1 helix-turn-helix domain-containing protein [Rhodoalgimonas zhirmunskyi]